MKRKFTKKYLDKEHDYLYFRSCFNINEMYPQYIKQYRMMIKQQFKIDPNFDSLQSSIKCIGLNYKDVNLLRILLLMSFEDAILNGEIK